MKRIGENWIKNIVLWTPLFPKLHVMVMREPAQIAEHLTKIDYSVKMLTYSNDSNKGVNTINNVELISLNGGPKLFRLLGFVLHYYVLRNRKDIDCLILYFATLGNAITSALFRLSNRRGVCIVKMDSNGELYLDTGHALIWNSKGTAESISYRRSLAGRIFRRFITELTLRLLSFATDLVIIESPEARQRVLNIHPWLKHKLVMLPNGINKEKFHQLSQSIETSREKKILFVGRIEYAKGVDLLLEAFLRLKDKYPDWHLELVGELSPLFTSDIEKLVSCDLKSRVVLAGPLYGEELAERFLRSEIFCFASRSESFGNVLIEAMYFGNAVISSDVGAARYVLDYGNAGMIFDNGDLDELITCLDNLMGEELLRKRLASLGKARCEKMFTWETIVEELDRYLSNISAKRHLGIYK